MNHRRILGLLEQSCTFGEAQAWRRFSNPLEILGALVILGNLGSHVTKRPRAGALQS